MNKLQRVFYYVGITNVSTGFLFAANCLLSLVGVFMVQMLKLDIAIQTLVCGGIIPFTSVILTPIISFIGDRFPIKRFKRRFFISIGSFSFALFLVLMGFSEKIGYSLGDEEEIDMNGFGSSSDIEKPKTHVYGVIWCCFFMFCSSIALSCLSSSSMTLVQDLVPYKHQKSVNTVYAVSVSIASISFYLLSGLFATFKFYYPFMFIIGSSVLAVTCIITCIVGDERKGIKEDKEEDHDDDDKKETSNLLPEDKQEQNTTSTNTNKKGFIKSHFSIDYLLLVILTITSIIPSNIYLPNMSIFFAQNIFHYDTTNENYSEAVSLGMFNICIMFLFETIFAFCLTPLMKRHTSMFFIISYCISIVGYVGFILLDYFARDNPGNTFIVIASFVIVPMFSLGMYSFGSIPFSILKKISEPKLLAFRTGFLISCFNLSMCLTAYMIVILLKLFGTLVVTFYVGLFFALVVVIISPFILFKINKKTTPLSAPQL